MTSSTRLGIALPLFVAIGTLSGCASVPRNAPHYTAAPSAPPGYQNVYIYRINAYPTLRTPTVAVDGRAVFDPPETAYTVIHIKPGTHWISTRWSWDTGTPPLSAPFKVKDEAVYIKISGDFTANGLSFRVGTELRGVSMSRAETELRACCRYVAAQGWDDQPSH